MRIWTLHPKYLDAVGLVALWRETLLARAVLRGATRGYRRHPQLIRFREQVRPVGCLNRYLAGVYAEACRRGYCFDPTKLGRPATGRRMIETDGQLGAEREHLLRKLRQREVSRYRVLLLDESPVPHEIFRIVPGASREWEYSAA